MLSATYIQQQAVLKLYSLMGCHNGKEEKKKFEKLKIRTLRHKLASHGLDYLDDGGGPQQAFVPVRMHLGGSSCTVTENRGDGSEAVDLNVAVIEHCDAIIDVLDRTIEKSIKTIFKGQSNRIQDFNIRLEEMREVRGGAILFKIQDSSEVGKRRILVTFTAAKEQG